MSEMWRDILEGWINRPAEETEGREAMSKKSRAERVAEACGLVTNRSMGIRHAALKIYQTDFGWVKFDPEHDVYDALLAAERYGPMRANCTVRGLTMPDGTCGWAVWHDKPRCAEPEMIGEGTFCDAICDAILKLEEQKP